MKDYADLFNGKRESLIKQRRIERLHTIAKHVVVWTGATLFSLIFLIVATSDKVWLV